MTRICLQTLGCKANQGDTDALREGIGQALDNNVHFVAADEQPDIVLLNTCTVTHTADANARQLIRRARRNNPDAKVVVTGCYAQTDAQTLAQMAEVDYVVGNMHKATLPALVRRLTDSNAPAAADAPVAQREWAPSLRDALAIQKLPSGRSRPFVKVQDGCNYVCSFCIIPKARGRSRSIPLDDIVTVIDRYEAAGAQEVVLTGIHLGHWGRDLSPKRRFGDMLESLLERTTIPRIRVSSLEPNEVDKKVLELVAMSPRVCPHLHVPLQSGDDATLGRMRRVYRTPWYSKIVDEFFDRVPGGAWGIDVMVGFPGEDDAAFQNTYRYLRNLPFTYLHVFPYSARRGTPAASMPNPVDPRVKRDRSRQLMSLSESRRAAHAAATVGRALPVLVESRRVNGRLRGYSDCYTPVSFDGPDTWMNQIVNVTVSSVTEHVAQGDRSD